MGIQVSPLALNLPLEEYASFKSTARGICLFLKNKKTYIKNMKNYYLNLSSLNKNIRFIRSTSYKNIFFNQISTSIYLNFHSLAYLSFKSNNICLNIKPYIDSNCNINTIKGEDIIIVTYKNALTNKFNIYKDNAGKSGIYRWVNVTDNKMYIGSSVNLKCRFGKYYSSTFLSNKLLTGNSRIYLALLTHGYANFNLDILEYCDKEFLFKKEQYYIDLYKPEYNIRKVIK